MHRKLCWLVVTCLALAMAGDVSADPVTFQFSGPVHLTSGAAPQQRGDMLVGSFTVDPDQLIITEQGPPIDALRDQSNCSSRSCGRGRLSSNRTFPTGG